MIYSGERTITIEITAIITSGGSPRSFVCLRQELKFAASGCMYLSVSVNKRWEWKTNLFGEKKTAQKEHLMHLALEELYLDGTNCPRHPHAHS